MKYATPQIIRLRHILQTNMMNLVVIEFDYGKRNHLQAKLSSNPYLGSLVSKKTWKPKWPLFLEVNPQKAFSKLQTKQGGPTLGSRYRILLPSSIGQMEQLVTRNSFQASGFGM